MGNEEVKRPLFWCCNQESRDWLKRLYKDLAGGDKLEIPLDAPMVPNSLLVETHEEFEREMKKAPRHQRKVE